MDLTKLDDSATARVTTERVFGRFLREGYRVGWIEWDSAFRGTDLQIGDLVVALNGKPYTDVHDANKSGSAIGMAGEEYYWKQVGGKEGDKISLTVVRDDKEFDIEGELRARRFYYASDGRNALAPGGPEGLKNDGFASAWSRWYEEVVKDWSFFLNNGWNRARLNNRAELAQHLEHESHVQYLQENYPGPFADTMRADYDRVIECLRGTRYELTEDDIAYRELGEQRATIAAIEAQLAWKGMLADVAGEAIDAFPAPDPDKRTAAVGKIVELPWVVERQITNDLGRSYAVVGGRSEGYYFIDLGSDPANRFYGVYFRYRGLVNPSLSDRYAFIGCILDEPRMITYQGDAITGLLVDVLAARVGAGEGEMFTDLRGDPPDTFAGETKLRTLVEVGGLSDDLAPEGVMAVVIRSVQLADNETWRTAFADWSAWSSQSGEVYLNRAYSPSQESFVRAWEHSRRNVTKDVYDSRVSKVDPVVTIAEANAELCTPRIQQVTLYVDHIGLFDGEYRAFNNVDVTRPWTLQRLGNGPWRITDVNHL